MIDCTIFSGHSQGEKPEELVSIMGNIHGIEDICKIIEEIENERLSIEKVFSVALENKSKAGFHAAWVLEKLCEKNPLYALYFADELCEKFDHICNQSSMREFAKLLAVLLAKADKGRLDQDLSTKLRNAPKDKIVQRCFEFLIDKKVINSTKQNCCELLLFCVEKEDWIKDELQAYCDSLQLRCEPSSMAYRKRLQHKLNSLK
ncbi:MAG: hypothetical protein ACI3Z9_04555 [Candidatus Onthomorpha sp.]